MHFSVIIIIMFSEDPCLTLTSSQHLSDYRCSAHLFTNIGLLLPSRLASLQRVPFGTSRYQNRKSITSLAPYSPISLTPLLPGSRLNTHTHTQTFSLKHMMDTHMHSAPHNPPPTPSLVEMLLTAAFRMKFHYTRVCSHESHHATHTHTHTHMQTCTQHTHTQSTQAPPTRLWM